MRRLLQLFAGMFLIGGLSGCLVMGKCDCEPNGCGHVPVVPSTCPCCAHPAPPAPVVAPPAARPLPASPE